MRRLLHHRAKYIWFAVQVAPASNRPAVLPDGSYATQVAAQESFTVSSTGIGLSTTNLRCVCINYLRC